MMHRRELRGSVAVVAGASSGVGRATAIAFAERGVQVVLAARSAGGLEDVAAQCRAAGVTATVVPVDLSTADGPQTLMDEALRVHGRVDTWVNMASSLIAGEFGVETPEEVEQLVHTNLVGPVFACQVALRQFRRQGHGVLIDVASMLGVVPNPMVPLYTMTKYGRRGLALALHQLMRDTPEIAVCSVLPGPIDTPLFQRAANHTGRALRAIPPAIAPERAAGVVVSCARRPRRQAVVGFSSYAILVGLRVAPALTETVVARYSARFVVGKEPTEDSEGALFEPGPPMQIEGGWRHNALRRKVGDSIGRLRARVV